MDLSNRISNRAGAPVLAGLACLAAFAVTQASGAPTSLALRSEPQNTRVFNGSQAIESVFGSSLETLPFSGTTTYHFYSPPVSVAVPLTTSAKGGGLIFMKNTATVGANDFGVLGRMQYYDYDPATGVDSLIVDTTDSGHKNVNHGQTVNWAIPNKNLTADRTIAAGHLLHVALTITLFSGNPGGFGQLLYNGASGSSTAALFPQNSALTWTFSSALAITQLADRTMRLSCTGTPAQTYVIQATASLTPPSWATLATRTADANGLCSYIDTDSTNYPCRFYRVSSSY